MKKISDVLNNGFIKFLFTIVKTIVWIIVILIVLIILVQRIFNNKVSIGSYRMFTVATGSMVPVYDVNDVIVSKEIPLEKINRGDDLVYLGEKDDYKGKIITHRVVDIKGTSGNYRFTTKGIANPDNDPEVEGKQVYGIVVKKLGILSFFSHILNNAYGLYFLIILPIAFLIFLEILDKIKEVENECEG